MPEAVGVRPFTAADDEAMLSWFASAAELERAAGRTLAWPLTRDQLQDLRDDPDCHAFTAFVAPRDDVPIAHLEIVGSTPPSHGRLARVVLDPARRGEGLARPIVLAVLDWARDNGFTQLDLRVFADNVPAIRTYEAAGFTTREPFPGDDRLLVLRCDLRRRPDQATANRTTPSCSTSTTSPRSSSRSTWPSTSDSVR
jgi:RimJ/RimL family protein N-acetyltransferase